MNKPTFEIQEVTFESDRQSFYDCDKCDVNGPCAEHNFEDIDNILLEKQLSYGKNKFDWSYLFILAIGLALGVLIAHPLIVNNI